MLMRRPSIRSLDDVQAASIGDAERVKEILQAVRARRCCRYCRAVAAADAKMPPPLWLLLL